MKTCSDCIHKSICYWAKSTLSSSADKCEDFEAEKTGHWIYAKSGKWFAKDYKCSECGNLLDFEGVNCGRGDANFCPNCGAKMESEGKE